jgi:ABC-type branched-subunit amino acid transport system substrate-binding protein
MTSAALRQAGRLARLACLPFALAVLGWPPSAAQDAAAQGSAARPVAARGSATWELKVCADPDNLPYSDREQQGFENRVLEILADEVGAEVSYAWLPVPRREGQAELMLRMGACDVLASVPDGSEPYLTTLPYYQSIETFVTREDAPFAVDSLDDPRLAELRIGVLRGSPSDYALVRRGMIDNVSHFFSSDPRDEILRRVVDGTLDVGILWGPIAGYEAERLDLPVTLEPVSPELDMPFLPMFQSLSFALRSDDLALADLLNAALGRRWEDVQAVLEGYGVPLRPLTPPGSPGQPAEGALRIGVVLPTLTGTDPVFPMGPELVGEPALRGAMLAAERLDVDPERPVELLVATAPTAEAAERAARRLAAAQGADVLVGGEGEGQAEAIAAVAEEFGLPFLDVGGGTLACRPGTFRVGTDDATYLDALARVMAEDGVESWYVVYTDTPLGEERHRLLVDALEREAPGGEEVGSLAVPPDQPLYTRAFDAIAESGAGAAVLLLEADAQLVFLGQYETAGVDAAVYAFPSDIAQTRQFYAALAFDAGATASAAPRVALWDASVADDAGLNERFLGRWGYPMDPAAWSAYAAVKVAVDAAAGAGSSEPEDLLRYLSDPDSRFDLHKGEPLAFREGDHQLVQPLYAVRLRPDAAELPGLAAVVDVVEVNGGEAACEGGR